MISDYEAAASIPQAKNIAGYSVDMTIKKGCLKNKKAMLTYKVNCIFRAGSEGYVYDVVFLPTELLA